MKNSKPLHIMAAVALGTALMVAVQPAWAAEGSGTSAEATAPGVAATDAPQEPQPDPVPLAKPKISSITQVAGGLQLKWKKVAGATSYTITRTDTSSPEKPQVTYGLTSSISYCTYDDTVVEDGHTYSYRVTARADAGDLLQCDSKPSSAKSKTYLGTPFISSAKRSGTTYKVVWAAVEGADGYQIQYSSSSLLLRSKTVDVAKETLSYKAKGVSSKTYYARVRAYQLQKGSRVYGPWSYSKEATSTRTTQTKLMKAGDSVFEVRTAAAQSMFGYDTLQGSCTDGTFGYYALHNKSNNKGKIVKVDMTNMKVLKVSKALDIYHANDLCYDPVEKRIVVVNAEGNGRNLSCVDAGTLKLTANSEHKLSSSVKSVPGAARAGVTSISGISAIAYNSQRERFVVTLSNTHDFLVLNRSFKPQQYVRPDLKSTGLFQGLECVNDMLMVCTSPKAGQTVNALFVYSWDGSFVSRLNVSNPYELESLFCKDDCLYASFYRSWYERLTAGKTALKRMKLKSNSKGKLAIKWAAMPNATKYRVYYRLAGEKTWKKKDVSSGKLSLAVKKLKKKQKYEVKVKATVSWTEFRRSGYTYKLTSV